MAHNTQGYEGALHPPKPISRWLIRGHIHEKWCQQQCQINVSVDNRHFASISEQTISDGSAHGSTNIRCPDGMQGCGAVCCSHYLMTTNIKGLSSMRLYRNLGTGQKAA